MLLGALLVYAVRRCRRHKRRNRLEAPAVGCYGRPAVIRPPEFLRGPAGALTGVVFRLAGLIRWPGPSMRRSARYVCRAEGGGGSLSAARTANACRR
jgi:hypothetical protein